MTKYTYEKLEDRVVRFKEDLVGETIRIQKDTIGRINKTYSLPGSGSLFGVDLCLHEKKENLFQTIYYKTTISFWTPKACEDFCDKYLEDKGPINEY